MATKTITLTGAEVAVTGLDGAHAHIRNDSAEVIYAAKTAGITAGADGVASIPAGQADTIRGISGTIYLLGTGSALIQSDDYVASPFKFTVTLGSVTEEISRAVSNPDLMINPDFRTNQRGESAYSEVGYTVDRWKLQFPNSSVSIEEGSYKLGLKSSALSTSIASVIQTIEEPERFCGSMVTLTVDYKTVVSNRVYIEVATTDHSDASHVVAGKFITEGAGKYSITGIIPDDVKTMVVRIYGADRRAGDDVDAYSIINYAKLELGSIATPFTPPDPSVELAKCQRYYQIRSTGDISEVDLRPSMRTTPMVTQLADGNYAYSAEL
ncbi:MAG: hypothetical protein ACI4RK_11145 [Oscillospiraceae bacterium]